MYRDILFGQIFKLICNTSDNIFDDTTFVMVYSLDCPDKVAKGTFKKEDLYGKLGTPWTGFRIEIYDWIVEELELDQDKWNALKKQWEEEENGCQV